MEKDDTEENKLFHSLLNIIGEMKENDNLDDIKDDCEDLIKVKSTEELIKDTVNAIRYLLKKQNDSELTVTEKVKLDLFQQSLESLYDLILTNSRYANSDIIINSENPIQDLIYSEVIKFDYNFYPLIYPKKSKMDHQYVNPNILAASPTPSPVLYNPQPQQSLMGAPPRQPLSNYYYYNRYWSFQQIQRQAYYQHFHPQFRRCPYPIYQPQYNPWDYISLQNLQYKMAECTEIRHGQPRRVLNTIARNSAQKYLEVIQYESYEKYLESRQLPINYRPIRAPGEPHEGWTFHEFTERYWQKTWPEQTKPEETTPYYTNENTEWNPTWSNETSGAQSYELQTHLQNKKEPQSYIVLSDYLSEESERNKRGYRNSTNNNDNMRNPMMENRNSMDARNMIETKNQTLETSPVNTETRNSIMESPRNLMDPSRNPVDSSRNIMDPSRNLMDSSRNLMDSSRNLMDSSRNLMDSSRNPMDSSRNLMDPSRNLMNPSRNLMNSPKESTRSLMDPNRNPIASSNPMSGSSTQMNISGNPMSVPNNPMSISNTSISISNNPMNISKNPMNSSRNLMDPVTNSIDTSKNLVDPFRKPMDTSRNTMNFSRNMMNPSRNTIDPSRNAMDSSINTMDSSRNTMDLRSAMNPSRNTMDPSRNMMEPSRNTMDPSRNMMESSRNTMDASRNAMDPSRNSMIFSRDLMDPSRTQMMGPYRNQLLENSGNSMIDNSRRPMMDNLRNQLNDSFRNPMIDSFRSPMIDSPRNPMFDSSRNSMIDSSRHQMIDSSRHQMIDSSRNQMIDPLRTAIINNRNPMMDNTRNQLIDTSRNTFDYSRNPMIGNNRSPIYDTSRNLMNTYRNTFMGPSRNTYPNPSRNTFMDPSRSYMNPMVDTSRNYTFDRSRNMMNPTMNTYPMMDVSRSTMMHPSRNIIDTSRNTWSNVEPRHFGPYRNISEVPGSSMETSRNIDISRNISTDVVNEPPKGPEVNYLKSMNFPELPTRNRTISGSVTETLSLGVSRNYDNSRNVSLNVSRSISLEASESLIMDDPESDLVEAFENISIDNTVNPPNSPTMIELEDTMEPTIDNDMDSPINTGPSGFDDPDLNTSEFVDSRRICSSTDINRYMDSSRVNTFGNTSVEPPKNVVTEASRNAGLEASSSETADTYRNVGNETVRNASIKNRNCEYSTKNFFRTPSSTPSSMDLETSTNSVEAFRNLVEASRNTIEASRISVEGFRNSVEAFRNSVQASRQPLETSTYQNVNRSTTKDVENAVEPSESELKVSGYPEDTYRNQEQEYESQEEDQNEEFENQEGLEEYEDNYEYQGLEYRNPEDYDNQEENNGNQDVDYGSPEENYCNQEDYENQGEGYSNEGEEYIDPEVYRTYRNQPPTTQYQTETFRNQKETFDNLDDSGNLLEASRKQLEDSKHLLRSSQLLDISVNRLESSRNSLQTSRNPLETSRNPLEASRNPLEASRNPLGTSSNPLQNYRNLFETSGNPLEPYRNPVKVYRNPLVASRNLSKVTRHQTQPSRNLTLDISRNIAKESFRKTSVEPSRNIPSEPFGNTSFDTAKETLGNIPRNIKNYLDSTKPEVPRNPVDSIPRQSKARGFDNIPGWNQKFDDFSSIPMFSDLFKKQEEQFVKNNKNFPKLPTGFQPRETPPNEDTIKQILFGTKSKSSDLPRKFCEVLHKDEKVLKIDDFPMLPKQQNVPVQLVKWPMTEPEVKEEKEKEVDDWWEYPKVEEDPNRIRRKEILESYVKEICSLQTIQVFSSIIEQYLKHEIDFGPVVYPLHYPLISANFNDYLPNDRPVYICLKPRLMETISQDLPFFKKNADYYLFHIKMSGFYADEAYNHLNYICELDIAKKSQNVESDLFKPQGRIKVSLAIERSIKNMNVIEVDLIEIWHRNEFGKGRWKHWLQSFLYSYKRFKEKFDPEGRRGDIGYDKEFKLDITFDSDQKDSFEKIFEEFDKYRMESVDETGRKIEEIFAKWFDHVKQSQSNYKKDQRQENTDTSGSFEAQDYTKSFECPDHSKSEMRSFGSYDFMKSEVKLGDRQDNMKTYFVTREVKSEFTYPELHQNNLKMNLPLLNLKSDLSYIGDRQDNTNKKYSEAVKSAVKPFKLENDDPPQFFNLNKLVPNCCSTMRNVRRSKPSESFPGPVSTQMKTGLSPQNRQDEEYVIWVCGRPIFVPRSSDLTEFMALNFDWYNYLQYFKVHKRMPYTKIFDRVLN